jgi:phage terminase large subunit-like protein
VISWIEHYLVHGPGDVQGQPIALDDEISGFVADCYAIDAAGRRRWDEAFLSRPKGRAKSELAGMLCCAEALAPVRFSHWATSGEETPWGYRFEPGEPVGHRVTYPFIRCLATEEGQSGHTYDNVSFMLERLTEQHGTAFPGIDLGRNANTSTRVFLPDGGEIRPSTASSAAKDGGKETFAVYDESHLYVLPELRSMYEAVSRNLTKRKAAQPWALQTSTMYAPGAGSIAEATHKAHEDGTAPRLLFDHRQGPEVDLDDLDALIAALVFVYGDAAGWMDLERIAAKIQDPRTDPADSYRYYLNRPHAGSMDAVDSSTWDAAAREDQLRPGDAVTLGFDGSRSRDATALVACRLADGRLFHLRTWVPADYPEERVPRPEVDRAVSEAFDAYTVALLFADPYRWQDYLDTWAGRWPKQIVEFPTNVERRMDAAIERFLTALRAGELTHDGHETLSQHARNAALAKGKRKPPRAGDDEASLSDRYLRVVKRKDGRLIDAFVAAILAYAARGQAIEDGALNEPAPQPFFAAWR